VTATTAHLAQKKASTLLYLLFLLLCCLVAYWPLTFHVFSLKNDALNYFLPVRYQISEAINNGHWPFWSPYFNLGYPLHGDMQSGVWNPFVQFFSLFGVYTIKTLQSETLLYIYLSGMGIYFLLTHFSVQKNIAVWASVAYMLCGFNSDSAQFLNWISAASFLPFVFLFYYRTLKEDSWKQAIFCGFFLYLLFVTAYPADFILTAYLLFVYLLVHLYREKSLFKRISAWNLVKSHFIIASCFLLLSSPAIISFLEFVQLSERGHGASYHDAMSNPLHPLLLFSYFAPLGVWRAPYISATDPLERNSYFGIITLLLLIGGFFIRSNDRFVRFCKWALIVSLIFSFGKWAGLRPLAYYLLPLMNTFRHPANAKLFTIFFACIVAAFSLQNFTVNDTYERYKKKSFYIVAGLLVAILLFAFFFTISFSGSIPEPTVSTLALRIKNKLDRLTFLDLIVINFILQLPFLVMAYFHFVRKLNLQWLITAGVVNCILFTMLFQPFTVVKKDSVASMQSVLNQIIQRGYPLPDLKTSLSENSGDGEKFFKEIGASNMYNKKISRINYRIAPSNLNTQNEYWRNTVLRNQLMNYPLIYRADTALFYTNATLDTSVNKRIVITQDSAIAAFVNQPVKTTEKIQVLRFFPNQFDFEIYSQQPGFYCLFQNYYPRWRLYIDGAKTEIITSNVSFMSFQLKAGQHLVSFRYKCNDLVIAFYINILLSLSIIIFGILQLFQFYSAPDARYFQNKN
jgi:hypothetical protein